MSPVRYRDVERSSTTTVATILVGALAGFAVGMVVSRRVGGWSGLRARLRSLAGPVEATRHGAEVGEYYDDEDDTEYDELEGDDRDEELEDRVLEAFRNDPILSERAIDIGSLGPGIIELAGWVQTEEESQHAVVLARGVPAVETVVNRITIGQHEEELDDNARRVEEGDPSLTEAHWEGARIGTGRRRQGTSDEPDRHADPAVELEDRWLNESEALRNAAEDTDGIAERRARSTGRKRRGSSAGQSSVTKADQIAKPADESSPM